MNEQAQGTFCWRVRLVDLAAWRHAFELDPACTLIDDPAAPVDVELQADPAEGAPIDRRSVAVRASADINDSHESTAITLSQATPPSTVVAVCRAVCVLRREWNKARNDAISLSDRLQRAEEEARRDFATGLLNRRGWHDRLAHLARTGESDGWSVGLLDLDDFKRINDSRGLAAGDAALLAVAAALAREQRTGEAAARWGGDEFVIAVQGGDPAHAARRFAEYQRAASSADVGIEGVSVTASIGWAGPRRLPPTGDHLAVALPLPSLIAQLLEHAETRLRESRSQTRLEARCDSATQ